MTTTATAARPHTAQALRARRKAQSRLAQAATSAPAPSAPEPVQAGSEQVAPSTKLQTLTTLLQRPQGARLCDLCAATGWQAHSVRGAIAGALKKRGLVITSQKAEGGRLYRAGATAAQEVSA